jgi:hypothetical protein
MLDLNTGVGQDQPALALWSSTYKYLLPPSSDFDSSRTHQQQQQAIRFGTIPLR